ncbi:hypothetical protein D3C72_1621800 [compost metagenome]
MQILHRAQAGAATQVGHDDLAARDGAKTLLQHQRLVFVRQAVEAIAAQAPLPRIVRQGQHLLDLRHRVVEGRVEARHLGDVGPRFEQHLDGFQRERLVQGRERHITFQVGQHGKIDAHGGEIFAAAMHHAVRHGAQRTPVQLRHHLCADVFERRVMRLLRIELQGDGRQAAGAVGGVFAADAFDLAAPLRLLRQHAARLLEQSELDARRTAIEHEDQGAIGMLDCCVHGGVLR